MYFGLWFIRKGNQFFLKQNKTKIKKNISLLVLTETYLENNMRYNYHRVYTDYLNLETVRSEMFQIREFGVHSGGCVFVHL